MLPEKDKAYLWDMLNAASEISEFVSELSFEKFEASKIIRYAVERQLLVLGEAAKHLSDETMDLDNEIPWHKIIALRNILAHEYGEILTERIWHIAKDSIPSIINKIKKILGN